LSQDLIGPLEGSKEHAKIEKKAKFSYQGLLGELLYSFIIILVSIGNAIQLLSKFSVSPHLDHYMALKNVCRYLRKHKAKGLIYWQAKPVDILLAVPFDILHPDLLLPLFPSYELTDLIAFANAAHATDMKMRQSVSAYIIIFAGAAIAYKAKMQSTIATSSTEAEFIAAVYAAKVVKHLRSVLNDLQLLPPKPTIIYEDNKATIDMINHSKPTARSHHIDVQHFAIQEWRNRGEIKMHHIPGILNPADDETKSLTWTLHSRHSRCAMGYYGPLNLGRA